MADEGPGDRGQTGPAPARGRPGTLSLARSNGLRGPEPGGDPVSELRTGRQGNRRQRCARWLGLDNNPLRRPADRLEAWLRVAGLALALAAIPAATLVSAHMLNRQAQAQLAADHQVTAVLTQTAPAGYADPYLTDLQVWTRARWTATDGQARTGTVLALPGTPAGAKVPVWINATGRTVSPPGGHRDMVAAAAVFGLLAGLVLILLLAGLQAAVRFVLDRNRFAAWDSEWRSTAPLWTGHRG